MPETSNLERAIGIVLGKLDGIEERLRHQDESRAKLYSKLDDAVIRLTHLEGDMFSVKSKVEAHEKVTVEVTTLRSKAEGAGTLGRWLIRIGIGVVTVAGWIIGAYTYITGRPPH